MIKMVTIHNAETNEIIEREMTPDEYAQCDIDEAQAKKREEEKAAQAQARTDLLTKLGISADEAKLLFS